VELLAVSSSVKFLVSQIAGFLVLAVIILKWVRPALGKALTNRSKEIEDTFLKIEADTSETSKKLAELKQKLGEVDAEAKRRLNSALEEANAARSRMLSEANTNAAAELDKARREVQIERDKAVLELRQETTRLTLAAAEHLVGAVMNDALHQKLVEKYLSNLEAVRK
jgi:F-type H+-transporting ATPase subunit b